MDVKEIKNQISAMAQTHPKADIALSIIDNIINIAESVSRHARRIPKYKLPRIASAARRRQKEAIALMGLSMYFGAVRQHAILSRPIISSSDIVKPGGISMVLRDRMPEIFLLNTGEELKIK